jgi:PilZ domain-containing protein
MSAVLVALGSHIPERRDQFRIRYRALGRPLYDTGEGQFPVLDLGRFGMCIRHADPERPSVGDTMTGVMRFSKGEPLGLTGTVVRVESTMIALRLEKPGVSLSGLMQEQVTWPDGQESHQAEPETPRESG